MTDFKRRPQLSGNTLSSRTNQPHIVGYNPKDANGEFPGITSLPAELRLETEASAGPISVSFVTDTKMSTIVDDINAQMSGFAVAEDRDGVLLIQTLGSGDGAFIRVHPAVLGYVAEDTSFTFGFPRYPDPKATVFSADEVQSPVRPNQQANPAGTGLLAFGEDRVASSYNRILQILSANADYLYTQLRRPIAMPEVIEVLDDVFWSTRLHYNLAGELDQINISGLTGRYEGRRVYVGNLTQNSSLEDIAEYFAVLDSDDKELLNGESKVYVGAVSRGLRPGFPPSFPNETSSPTSPLFNTSGVGADGGNALGVDRIKSTEAITEVLFRSSIRCAGATFVSDGVVTGDKATITLASVDVPFNHNGTYYVDVVVSEEELILRPVNAEDRGELNPDILGVFGSVQIRSTGELESGIFVTLVPPLPRFPPESGHLKLVLGMESTAGSLLIDSELIPGIRAAEEVDAYVLKEIERRLTLDGVYDSTSDGNGAGFYARVDGRPITAGHDLASLNPSIGTVNRAGTGEVLANNILSVNSPDVLTSEDIGRVVSLTGVGYLTEQLYVISHVLDGGKARLTPTTSAEDAGALPPVSTVSYEILEGSRTEAPAAFNVIATNPGWGFAVDSRQAATGTSSPQYKQGFIQLERVKLSRLGANISRFSVTFDGTAKVGLPFDPEDNYNITPEEESDTRGTQNTVGSLLVVHNGPHAGFYRVRVTHSSLATDNSIEVVNLDGTTPTLATVGFTVEASFYNTHLGTKVPFAGTTTGTHIFHDGIEHGDATAEALRVNWRGTGRGIALVLNDPAFAAYANGDGADGYAVEITGFTPADGIHVQLEADVASATPEARATKGLLANVRSSHHQLALDPASSFAGWAGNFQQRGEDPSVVAVRAPGGVVQEFGAATAFPAALVGLSHLETGIVGRGASAAEVYGTVYQSRDISDGGISPLHDEGGLFTETAAGLGRHAYPLSFRPTASGGVFDPAPYFGQSPGFSGWGSPTRLGQPGQILPSTTDSTISVRVLAPDFGTFNFPHAATVEISGLAKPLSQYIGTIVALESSPGADPEGLLGETDPFVVQAVQDVEGGFVLAVAHSSALAVTSGGIDDDFEARLLGSRWYESHIDLADWMLIGTRFERGDRWKLPALTLADTVNDLYDRTNQANGLLSYVPYPPMTEGVGVGARVDLGDLSLNAVSAFGRLDDPWQQDGAEPASPFPNVGLSVSPTAASHAAWLIGQVFTRAYEGSLETGDIRLEQVTTNTTFGVEGGFAPSTGFGPSFRVVNNFFNPEETTETVRVWFRGVRAFTQANAAIRVRAIIEQGQVDAGGNRTPSVFDPNKNYTISLRDSDGNVLATSATLNMSFFRNENEVVFEFDDLEYGHYSKLEQSRLDTVGVHAVFEFSLTVTDEGPVSEYVQFHRVEVEMLTRAAHLTGPILASGPVVASAYRYITPVRGFQTISPADVSQMRNTEFAKELGHNAAGGANRSVGGTEMHDVGLVMDANDVFWMPVYDTEIFFKKGVASATITGRYPYYDPLWYPVIAYEETVGDTEVDFPDPDRYVLPGRTGFLLPLDPPHGSQLTELHTGLSIRPKWRQNPIAAGRWEMWHSIPNNAPPNSDPTWQQWRDPSEWQPLEGYWIRLWRHHTLDFGKIQQDRDWGGIVPGVTEASGGTLVRPEFGYAEVLWEDTFSLSGSVAPDFDENPAADADVLGGVSREAFFRRSIDLATEIADVQKRTVDRRQYSYYVTIEFWLGWRDTITNGVDPENPVLRLERNPGGLELSPFRQTVSVPARGAANVFRSAKFQGIPIPYPLDTFALPDFSGAGAPVVDGTLAWPTVVKFRGARLGWITDRGGHGGWG